MIENCLKAIDKAKNLRNLNIFIKETFDLALSQAEKSHARVNKQSKLFL